MNPPDASDWDETVKRWAHGRPDVSALVQIGSRVQPDASPDASSDYDYQLITPRREKFRTGEFVRELGPCWAVGREQSFGHAIKVTGIFPGAREVDFVVLKKWEVVVATFALRFPGTASRWPALLRRGTEDLRIVAGQGWKMIKGGPVWENRYRRI